MSRGESSRFAASLDDQVEMWKIRRVIEGLEAARGHGTSLISLYIHPRDQLSKYSHMLVEEFGAASNIKSSKNKGLVQSAILSVQNRLKLYHQVPPHGIVIFCGTILTEDGKERKMNIDFEPFRPVSNSFYLCGSQFHTMPLWEMVRCDDAYGFIVMDGNGTLFGSLRGNNRTVLHKVVVELPKKHGRGGQSALRFARLRMEKRHNYLRKIAESSVQLFIENERPNIAGLVVAGSADFKTELASSDMLDPRLREKIVQVVDVSYGGENGFNQAIDLSADSLSGIKYVQEKKLIEGLFEHINRDTGKYVFGAKETIQALESGMVEDLIVWEDLKVIRRVEKSRFGEDIHVSFLEDEERQRPTGSTKDEKKTLEGDWEIVESQLLSEWVAENYQQFGAKLHFVTDKSQEGAQFCKGFGGLGGILRYATSFDCFDETISGDEDDESI